jgi:hypothetical protein
MLETDQAYFTRRASDERTAAISTRDAKARKSHIELADRYGGLVRGIVGHQRLLGPGGTLLEPAFDDR